MVAALEKGGLCGGGGLVVPDGDGGPVRDGNVVRVEVVDILLVVDMLVGMAVGVEGQGLRGQKGRGEGENLLVQHLE